jgi:predicted TPR repeat methyltransferase
MQPLFLSSGDPLLDRRYKWAMAHLERGDSTAAIDILQQTVAASPGFAIAWFALGLIHDRLGERACAVAALETASKADPDDYLGARLHLARLGVGDATPAMTHVYLQRLFDDFAPEFDKALVERLDYCGPQLLLAAVTSVSAKPLHLGSVLDLGCGTGLAGAAFRPHCECLTGVDISPGMIEQSRAKGIYDRLEVGEVVAFLSEQPKAEHDLAVAADVFVYSWDLVPIAAAVAPVLAPGGLFAFTVEAFEGNGVRMHSTLRYKHGADHVRTAMESAGLRMLMQDSVSTRTESGEPVPGLLVIGRR